VPVDQIDPNAVAGAAHGMPKWGPDTVRNALMACESLLRFCGRTVTIQKPPRGSAGAKAVIPEDVYRRAVELATGDLGPLLVVLWNTGARPGEVRQLTAEQVDWSAGVATLTKHKTARKTGKPRLIVFPPAALQVLERQRAKYGTGYLFRHCRGEPFSSIHLTVRVWGLSKKVGVRLTAVGCRHSFCTDALAAGLPETHVAALLGHSSTAMITKHYGHLSSRTQLLKDAAAKVRPA
jgi:integrase